MRGQFFLVSLFTAILVLASVFAVSETEPTNARSRQILTTAADLEAQIISQLGPDVTLHGIEEAYRRHGPVAQRLAEEPSDFYLPEVVVTEGWLSFDASGNFVALKSQSRALDGTIYQEAWIEDGEFVVRDVVTGVERRFPHRQPGSLETAESYKAFQLKAALAWFDEILDGTTSTLHETLLDGEPVWVVERSRPVAERFSSAIPEETVSADRRMMFGASGPLQYTLPYVADLDLQEEVLRWTIRQSDHFLVREEVIGIESDGQEYLLASRERILYEIVPR